MLGRVVFTSGDMLREETQAFLRKCGCPALQKPYELSELVSVLRSLRPAEIAGVTGRRASA